MLVRRKIMRPIITAHALTCRKSNYPDLNFTYLNPNICTQCPSQKLKGGQHISQSTIWHYICALSSLFGALTLCSGNQPSCLIVVAQIITHIIQETEPILFLVQLHWCQVHFTKDKTDWIFTKGQHVLNKPQSGTSRKRKKPQHPSTTCNKIETCQTTSTWKGEEGLRFCTLDATSDLWNRSKRRKFHSQALPPKLSGLYLGGKLTISVLLWCKIRKQVVP